MFIKHLDLGIQKIIMRGPIVCQVCVERNREDAKETNSNELGGGGGGYTNFFFCFFFCYLLPSEVFKA